MTDDILYEKLPYPPGDLTDSALETWFSVGNKLVDENRLTSSSLEKLTDLCFWEKQKSSVMEKLKTQQAIAQRSDGAVKTNTSAHLANLKAIQKEMDKIRPELGLSPVSKNEIAQTPLIPESVFRNLPDSLADCCSLFDDDRKRDLFLTTSLPVIAGHLCNIKAEHADGYFGPDINMLLIDDSGAAKGMANKARDLGTYLHHQRLEKNRTGTAGLFIPPDSGMTGIADELAKLRGSGILFQSNHQILLSDDFPDSDTREFLDLIRKSFSNETVIFHRNNGKKILKEPHISTCLICSSERFKQFSEIAGEDLFAFFALYSYRSQPQWQSHQPDRSTRKLNKQADILSEKLFAIHRLLAGRDDTLFIDLTQNQWKTIDETFAEKMQIIEELDLPESLHASNKMAAILTLRLATVFSVMRVYETDPEQLQKSQALTPMEQDMIAALWLADTYIKHAIRVFQIVPEKSRQDARGQRFDRFFQILPFSFDTSDAVKLAEKIDIPIRTAKRYLNIMLEQKKLVRVRRGRYKKNR